MRKNLLCTILLVLVGLFLVGCSDAQSIEQPQQAKTIFGQLSQYVQLGSTQETIAYKQESGPFFVTIRGEVLMSRPSEVIVTVTERESGIVRNDLAVTFDLCHAMDEDLFRIESCSTFDGPLYRHELTTTNAGGRYRADAFEWERPDEWRGILTIAQSATTAGQTGEVHTVETNLRVYPARPPSTNLFELFNLSLPFVVIGLFLLGLWFFKGRFLQPANVIEGKA